MFTSSRGQSVASADQPGNAGTQRELELLRTVNRLERANNDLKRTVLVAGHDFQEPIRAIVSSCEEVRQNKGSAPEKIEKALSAILRGADGLSTSVQAMLA